MENKLKGICAFALSLSLAATTLTACGKKIEYNEDYTPTASANGENVVDTSGKDPVIIQDGTSDNQNQQSNNSGDNMSIGGSVGGGSSSGGNSGSYSGGSSSGNYSGGGSNAASPSGGSSSTPKTTKKNGISISKTKKTTTQPTVSGERTTRVPTSKVVDKVKVLNSARLNPMVTHNEKLDNMVEDILAQIAPDGMSTYDKVRAIYNYLVQTNRYGHALPFDTTGTYTSVYDAEVVNRALNILKNHTGDCMDFSCAFMVLTRKIGLDCYYVTGQILNKYGEESYHGWNIIKINGVDYGFDSEGDFRASDSGRKETTYWNFCVDDPVKYKSTYTKIAVARFRSFRTK